MILKTLFLPILALFAVLTLTACNSALLRLGKFKTKEALKAKSGPKLFFRSILHRFFRHQEWENLYFCVSVSKQIYQLLFAMLSFFYLLSHLEALHHLRDGTITHDDLFPLFSVAISIIAVCIFSDFLIRLISSLWSLVFLKISAPIASLFLVVLFPLLAPLLKLLRISLQKTHFEAEENLVADQGKIREMIHDSELQKHLDPGDQKLIGSFINFKQRVAKEIMVPRVDVYALEAKTSIQEAAAKLAKEGYSRIPVFKESLDQITGVILYKDLLKCLTETQNNLNTSIEPLTKPVLYAPENKKISLLLQEFRLKHIHMAIIVDEYGGTEGIVTIEDILEELVGEIEDEYDIEDEDEFLELPGGSFLVDAKMTLLDIENQIGIKIPQTADYETIGGYVFHRAGTIPAKGWRLSHDEFELEVISSNERSLQKIKIIPRQKS